MLFLSLFLPLIPLLLCFLATRPPTIRAIAYQEWRSLIFSALCYLVLFSFSLLLCYLFVGALERLTKMPRLSLYCIAPLFAFFHDKSLGIAFLILIPTITMRLLAEERAEGTYDLLLSYPIPEREIVLGKFCGVFWYYILLLTPSFFYVLLLSMLGKIDCGQIGLLYFSLFLYGAAFLSIGLMVSSLFRSQLASFMTTMALLLPFQGGAFLEGVVLEPSFFSCLSLKAHLQDAARGILSSSSLVLFTSILCVCLYLSTQILSARKWLGGHFPPKRERGKTIAWIWLVGSVLLTLFLAMEQKGMAILFLWVLNAGIARWLFFLREPNPRQRFGLNAIVASLSVVALCILGNSLSFFYQGEKDCTQSQAFTLEGSAIQTIEKALPLTEEIQAFALLGYSEKHVHEHTERDNERYFLLTEAFGKIARRLNRPGYVRFRYEFIHPVGADEKVASYLEKDQARKEKIAFLQNRYGLLGYREVILLYRNRYHVLQDEDLFEKKLTHAEVPRLLLLWRKIYEQGGIEEAPPEKEDEAFLRLQEMANPEMLRIFSHPDMEKNLLEGIHTLLAKPQRQIYFTQGAGEKITQGLMADDSKTAYRLAQTLQRYNFSVRALSLSEAKEIPADCDFLVILGTSRFYPWREETFSLLDSYLARGGRIVLTLEAGQTNLFSWLQKKGFLCENRIALRYASASSPLKKMSKSPILAVEAVTEDENHPLSLAFAQKQKESASLYSPIFVGQAMPISAQAQNTGERATPILFVSPRIISESFDGSPPQSGPFSLGALLEYPSGGKLALLGDTLFISDTPFPESRNPLPFILVGSNRFFLPLLLETLLPPSPALQHEAKEPRYFSPLVWNPWKEKMIWYANIGLFAIILGVGFFVVKKYR